MTEDIKVVATNRKASFEYFLLEKFEAGLSLKGSEIKSIRAGQISIKEAFVDVKGGKQAFLLSAHIAPYEQANQFNHEPERPRKLLMHKHEIIKIGSKVHEKGLTLIPLKLYFKRGKVKVELGLCRGKDNTDKRHDLKAKEAKRDMDRAVRDAQKT